MSSCEKALERNFDKLRAKRNVLNVSCGTKIKKGVDTGIPSIIVYVHEKVSLEKLSSNDVIPPIIDSELTDVQVLSSPDFQLGDTAPSRKSPKIQKLLVDGASP